MANNVQLWVAVASENSCKIEAVQTAFERTFRGAQVIVFSYDVPSGVSAQPVGDKETKKGAMNRAKEAFDAARKDSLQCDFAVGIEGGVEEVALSDDMKGMWCMAWMAVVGNTGAKCTMCKAKDSSYTAPKSSKIKEMWGFARSGSFLLPREVAELVENGMELGQADDMVFSRVDLSQNSGTIGALTNHLIDRREFYIHALMLAMVPFIRPEHYAVE